MAKKTPAAATKVAVSKTPSAPAVETDAAASPADAVGSTSTKARGSSVPPKSTRVQMVSPAVAEPAAAPKQVTDEHIAEHAYHLWRNGTPGSHDDHWFEAERTLRSKEVIARSIRIVVFTRTRRAAHSAAWLNSHFAPQAVALCSVRA